MTPLELRISDAIRSSGLTYTEIARRTDVERTAVGKWAKTGKITVNNFVKLCSAINVSPMNVLFGLEYEEVSSVALQGVSQNQKLLIEKILTFSKDDDDFLGSLLIVLNRVSR
ncbi:helix-turn-helix transcriptional regulator (plasmid) [Vibrio scophthalmi]|uniref:helix-turn-helix domain-containing protein n=1 Tax=Vibrio scophthalmi TaxID=45658 RepID=UPI00080990CF|nr:helix-turn-helix transcriptional regulator [Vibrio scophthalmi]ANS88171.1 hypothetical protein VSVS12_04473 [Vibrio scophthalmi]